jgi:hypothetical protein
VRLSHVLARCLPGLALHGSSLALALGAVTVACGGRTNLAIYGEVAPPVEGSDGGGEDAARDGTSTEDVIDSMPAPPKPTPTASPTGAPTPGAPSPPATAPSTDPCASMPPLPCAGGGYQYCVAGHYSQCPKRCSVCVPGSSRVCFLTYCKAWGTQTCAADGLSFGYCQEGNPPSQCQSVGDDNKPTPALEQCCIDSGRCCQDLFDLNGNGATNDLIGNCSGTSCN